MDRRQFLPRYESTIQLHTGHTGTAKTSPQRIGRAPMRSAPPIVPPRNPRRVGKAPRAPETVGQIWDPEVGDYVPRQPNGGFARIKETSGTGTLQRSSTLQPTSLLISARDQRKSFGSSLHEEIQHLRQSYTELQNDDDVFAPTTPPRRSASVASLRTPFRNFSLPTYTSPTKQPTPLRPLRRVRSRSVNLGPVAEASELPEYPLRRQSHRLIAAARETTTNQPESESESETASTQVIDTSETSSIQTDANKINTATQPVETSEVSTMTGSENTEQTAAVGHKKEGTCNSCGSNRKALAMNPMCCIDRPEMGRVCYRCWSDLLADGVSKPDPKEWLNCLLCGEELAMRDAKRLASGRTIIK